MGLHDNINKIPIIIICPVPPTTYPSCMYFIFSPIKCPPSIVAEEDNVQPTNLNPTPNLLHHLSSTLLIEEELILPIVIYSWEALP